MLSLLALEDSNLLIQVETCSDVMRGIVKKVSVGPLLSTKLHIFSAFRAGVLLSFTFIILAMEVK